MSTRVYKSRRCTTTTHKIRARSLMRESEDMKIFYSVIVIFLVSLREICCQDKNAGMKVVLTQQGLNYAANIALDILTDKVANARFDDVKDEKKIFLGRVSYEITNIRVTSFTKPSPSLTVNPGQGVTLSLSGGAMGCEGNWAYKLRILFGARDSGSVTASANGVSITVSVRLGVNQNFAPTISVASCSASVGDISFKLRGGASWLYNLFLGFFKSKIRSAIENLMCKEANKAINENAAKQLSTLNLQAKINNLLTLDYSLTSSPVFGSNFMESSHVGRFLYDNVVENAVGMSAPAERMVTIMVSEVSLNSASRLLFKNQKLRFVQEFSGDAIIDMVSSLLEDAGIPFKGVRLSLYIGASSPPVVTIKPGSIYVKTNGEGNFNITSEDKSKFSQFSVKLTVEFEIRVSIKEEKVVGSIINFVPALTYCSIPNVNVVKTNGILKLAVQSILPLLNSGLQEGMPLPNMKKISFPDATIQLNQGYFAVATNVLYQP